MALLYLLERIRTPFFDTVFSLITHLGDKLFFIFLALLVFWCIDKKSGYYLLATCFFGLIANQFLKITCRVERPWVADKSFTIVESAREAATGYSFPSGHTQNIASSCGLLAARSKNRTLRIICAVVIALVSFSRMYLGVHTPHDVVVSLLIAAVLIVIMQIISKAEQKYPRIFIFVILAAVILSAAFLIFMEVNAFPENIDPDNFFAARKNAYSFFGGVAGLALGYFLDTKYIKFDTKAPLIAQVIKLVVGGALTVGIMTLTKNVLLTLTNGAFISYSAEYFVTVLFAGCLFPLTFKYLSRIGKRKNTEEGIKND